MRRILAIGCISLLLFSVTATPLAALTPTYTVSGTYKSSKYHKNLEAVTKTGDAAFDTVAAALSQLDYREGNSKADFNGENNSGSKNYTEYNRAMGTIGGSYSYAWCAAFVSWCLDVAGARDSAGGKFTSCTLWVDRLRELGLYSTRASGYTPKAGDLIFFRSAGVTRASDHVGLVRYVKNGRVYTVEGNSSNKVALHDYALTDTYIVGYGKPRYTGTPLSKTALQLEDAATGLYMVTNDFLNVRATPAATAAKRGTLYRGTLIEIVAIENGWGKISYGGKDAFVSLDYADFVTPVFYTVTYTAPDAENCPPRASYFSFEQVVASSTVPEREGYRFLHWADAAGRSYAAGDALPVGDLALEAVFEPLPLPEAPTPEEPPVSEDAPTAPPSDNEEESLQNGLLDAPPSIDSPTAAPQSKAAAEAGTVTGVLAAALALWWYAKKYLLL